jgi:hypothetical protein
VSDAVEWRADAGAALGAGAFGVLDLGVRRGPWSAELFTDTLDLRWSPSGPKGRGWVGARAAAWSAGFLPFTWTDGARDPGRSMGAGYAGPDAGVVRYGPGGTYAGVSGAVRTWWFVALPTTAVDLPGVTPVVTAEGILGWWRPDARAELRLGADARPERVSPHVRGEAAFEARDAPVSPRLEVRGQWAARADRLTRLRLGGTSPYVLPLAGLGVAEHRVEDVLAARLGAAAGTGALRGAAFVDAAWFDGAEAAGVGAALTVRRGTWFAETEAGAAPWTEREAGAAWGVWLGLGTDWRPARRS